MNIIPGVEKNGVFDSPLGKFSVVKKYEASASCCIIRPERIRFACSGEQGAFKARLAAKTFLGESCDWQAEAEGVKLIVRESAPLIRQLGTDVFLKFDDGFLQVIPERD